MELLGSIVLVLLASSRMHSTSLALLIATSACFHTAKRPRQTNASRWRTLAPCADSQTKQSKHAYFV
eukprot:1774625-Pleurochrysis_carterae.AAC.1